jgi:hypothetical protein
MQNIKLQYSLHSILDSKETYNHNELLIWEI